MIGLFERGSNESEFNLGRKLFIILSCFYLFIALIMILNAYIVPTLVCLLLSASYMFGMIFIMNKHFNQSVALIHANGIIYTLTNCLYFGFDYGFQFYCLHTITFCYVGIFADRWQVIALCLFGTLYYIGLYLLVSHGLYFHKHLVFMGHDLDYFLFVLHVTSISFMFLAVILTMRNRLYANIIDKTIENLQTDFDENLDYLSGLLSRVAFNDQIDALENIESANMALIDIDHFKRVNEFYGYLKGDEVIAKTAALIKEYFPNCLATRWGGEEFLVFCERTSQEEFYESCSSFLERFKALEFDPGFSCSCSIGCLFVKREYKTFSFDEYLSKLDKNLDDAKSIGASKIVSTNF